MENALRLHYEQHPAAKPTLGEVALALATQDGSPLADRPDLIASAAEAVATRRADADADDVAAQIQGATTTGVADAHIGATVHSLSSSEIVVLTSDPVDIAAVCSPAQANIVTVWRAPEPGRIDLSCGPRY